MAHLPVKAGSSGGFRLPVTAFCRPSQPKLQKRVVATHVGGRGAADHRQRPQTRHRRHDNLHAFNHPIRYEDLDEGFVMLIGPTRSAHLIELGFIDTDKLPVIVR